MMIVGILLAAIVMVTALYGFGYFNTPYIGTFRIAFYFSLIFLVVTLVVAAMFETLFAAGVFNENAPHSLSGCGKEVRTAFEVLVTDKSQISFMDQRGRA